VIREAIDAVAAKAVTAANPQARIYQPPYFPRTHYLVTGLDGAVDEREVPTAPADDALGHFAAVPAWYAGMKDDADDPAVFYSRTGLTALLSASTRRNRARLPLPYTKPMQWLIEADKKPVRLTQPELVRLLKTTLAGVAPLDLIGKIRTVQVEKVKQSIGVVDKGKISQARSSLSKASGIDELPDELVFTCQVHETSELVTVATVKAAFDLDPTTEDGHFLIDLQPGEVEFALASAEAEIGTKVAALFDGEGPKPAVIRGTPSL